MKPDKSIRAPRTLGAVLPLSAIVLGALPPTVSAAEAEAAAEPAEPKIPKWESSVGLGFAVATGNSENLLFTFSGTTQLLKPKDELRFGVAAGYGESRAADDPTAEMEKNTDFVGGFGQYNRTLSDRWYALGRVEALYDSIADINYRVPISVGAGYYFLKDEKFKLSADAGPGYVFEKVGGVSDDYASLRFAEQFEWKISDGARLWQRLEYTPQVTDFGNYVVNATLGIESRLYKSVSLSVVALDSYRSEPAPDRENNDFKLTAGLTYAF